MVKGGRSFYVDLPLSLFVCTSTHLLDIRLCVGWTGLVECVAKSDYGQL